MISGWSIYSEILKVKKFYYLTFVAAGTVNYLMMPNVDVEESKFYWLLSCLINNNNINYKEPSMNTMTHTHTQTQNPIS